MRLTLFLSLSHFLSSFLCRPLSRYSLPRRLLSSRSKSNSRRVELTGRGPAPTEIDFGKTKRARERWLCKGERCDTDYGPAELPSDLLCMYRESSLFLHRTRSWLVSSPSPLPTPRLQEDAPKRVSMCHAQRFPGSRLACPKLGLQKCLFNIGSLSQFL